MLRAVIIVCLSTTFAILINQINQLSSFSMVEEHAGELSQKQNPNKLKLHNRERVEFYPPVPVLLPDLTDGYLFNKSRSLRNIEESPKKEVVVEKDGIDIKMDDVIYNGSLIGPDYSKALITYRESEPIKPRVRRVPRRRRPSQKNNRIKRSKKSDILHKKLAVGDFFAGYQVAQIHPDKLVFENDTEMIDKPLYDTSKNRLTAPRLPGNFNRTTAGRTKRPTRTTKLASNRLAQNRRSMNRRTDQPQPRGRQVRTR